MAIGNTDCPFIFSTPAGFISPSWLNINDGLINNIIDIIIEYIINEITNLDIYTINISIENFNTVLL